MLEWEYPKTACKNKPTENGRWACLGESGIECGLQSKGSFDVADDILDATLKGSFHLIDNIADSQLVDEALNAILDIACEGTDGACSIARVSCIASITTSADGA